MRRTVHEARAKRARLESALREIAPPKCWTVSDAKSDGSVIVRFKSGPDHAGEQTGAAIFDGLFQEMLNVSGRSFSLIEDKFRVFLDEF